MTIARSLALRGRRQPERRYSADLWLTEYGIPAAYGYGYQPAGGLVQSWPDRRVQEVSSTLPGYFQALLGSPPAFAAELTRASVLSQARFTFRSTRGSAQPGRMFGTQALGVLERPWRNGTTGDLISRCEWHAGLAGNAFVARRPDRLRVLRPDWTAILYGSDQEPEDAAHALDGELIGYAYVNGGLAKLGTNQVTTLLPDEVAHWAPIPDPLNAGIGMSWLTPALRDMQGDRFATEHKLKFFSNAGTPNMVVKGIPATTKEQFDGLVAMMEDQHAGLVNAYKTLYLTAGADATVVGSDLQQMDFRATQGAGETRIAMLSLVHPVILAAAEGLQGSALNAGNFGMARRIWADKWIYPALQDLAASLETLVQVPTGAELWPDTADMPILREDAKDAADIELVKQQTITGYVKEGFTPDSAVAAVQGQNVSLLKHTGLVSVQLQPPGGPAGLPEDAQTARNVAELLQKLYLGVGVVISEAEARDLLNQAGAALPLPGPDFTPTPAPAIPG